MRMSIVALVALALAMPSMAHAEDPERVVMKLDDFLDMHEKAKKPAKPAKKRSTAKKAPSKPSGSRSRSKAKAAK